MNTLPRLEGEEVPPSRWEQFGELKNPLIFCCKFVQNQYNKCVKFEWDVAKSAANRAKHGIDFDSAKNIWLDENRVEIRAAYPVEDRTILVGQYQDKLWTAIYTMRGDTIRIISVRRAREKEARLYEEETGQE